MIDIAYIRQVLAINARLMKEVEAIHSARLRSVRTKLNDCIRMI